MHFTFSAHSEQGPRAEQSDRLLTLKVHGGLLVAVLDGVGSGKGGDLAAEAVSQEMRAYALAQPGDFLQKPVATLAATIQAGKDVLAGMEGATTCTALLLLEDGRSAIGHIGDCALFLQRGAVLHRLTQPDRTYPDAARRRYLSKALHSREGARATADFHVWMGGNLELGDVFLLASDGCYEGVPEVELHQFLAAAPASSAYGEWPARQLVNASLSAGTNDNTSAIFVWVRP
jgi:serine/threonine protein phosphatase PrpC